MAARRKKRLPRKLSLDDFARALLTALTEPRRIVVQIDREQVEPMLERLEAILRSTRK